MIYIYLYDDVGASVQLLGTRNLTVGWHHLAAVYINDYTTSEDVVALYLDGSLLISSGGFQFRPGIANTSSPVYIGGNAAGSAQLSRWIEETRFSAVARYNTNTYTVPTAPFSRDSLTRALWHFDEAVGSTVFQDSSVNGNTLTGYNGAQTGNP
jgi:hypothetical protein